MKNRVKWIVMFLLCVAGAYYTGVTLGAPYDNVWNELDLLSIFCGLGILVTFFKAKTA